MCSGLLRSRLASSEKLQAFHRCGPYLKVFHGDFRDPQNLMRGVHEHMSHLDGHTNPATLQWLLIVRPT